MVHLAHWHTQTHTQSIQLPYFTVVVSGVIFSILSSSILCPFCKLNVQSGYVISAAWVLGLLLHSLLASSSTLSATVASLSLPISLISRAKHTLRRQFYMRLLKLRSNFSVYWLNNNSDYACSVYFGGTSQMGGLFSRRRTPSTQEQAQPSRVTPQDRAILVRNGKLVRT